MGSLKFVAIALLAGLLGSPAFAQSAPTYGLGRTPSAEEIRARDINVGPTGDELPPGSRHPQGRRKGLYTPGVHRLPWPRRRGRGTGARVEIEDKPRSSHLETGAHTATCAPRLRRRCGITSIAVCRSGEKGLSPTMRSMR